MKRILAKAESLQESMRADRRAVHRIAEVDLALTQTAAYVKKRLKELGYAPVDVGECGVSATVGGKRGAGEAGKVILLRADMDALPGAEGSGLEFAATNGHMHACGHDLHTAMLLGAAEILKGMEDELLGTVKFMFQPGEETLRGAASMIAGGILENPKVDAAMMLHVFSGFPFPTGFFGIPEPGPSSAASDWFEIQIQGRGTHGAMPNYGVDPINVACHTHLALQELISREIQPTDSAVVTVGYIQGGSTANVIPDTAKLGGTVRTFSAENRALLEKRIHEIAEGVGRTFRAESRVEYRKGCPAVVNDRALRGVLADTLAGLFGKESLLNMALMPGGGKMMGSEDFSFVTEKVPSIMAMLTAGNSKEGYVYPQHHPKVAFDESVLYKGAAAYAAFAAEWLGKAAATGGRE